MTSTRSTLTNSRGVDCILHTWEPSGDAKGVCVIYHGFATHGQYPTLRYLAELLLKQGLVCMCLDLEGHGASPGTPGLIHSHADLVNDGLAVAKHAAEKHPDLPLFLAGNSMGGAIALNVSRKWTSERAIVSLILLAPMVKLPNQPKAWTVSVLGALSWLAPSAPVLPKGNLGPEASFRDPERLAECVADTITYNGGLRLASAHSCVKTAMELHDNLQEVKVPFAVLFGTGDIVTDIQGADDLMHRSATPAADKKFFKYDDALHGLLAEPLPLRTQIEEDIAGWVRQRLNPIV